MLGDPRKHSSLQTRPHSRDCENLSAMDVIGSRGGRIHMATQSPQGQGGQGRHEGQQSPSSNQNSVTPVDLWRGRVNDGVCRWEVDGKPTEPLLDLCEQKSVGSSERKSNLSHNNRLAVPQLIPGLELVYRLRAP